MVRYPGTCNTQIAKVLALTGSTVGQMKYFLASNPVEKIVIISNSLLPQNIYTTFFLYYKHFRATNSPPTMRNPHKNSLLFELLHEKQNKLIEREPSVD